MTATTEAGAEAASHARLAFARTVERHLVHRASVAEVFVTDSLPNGTDRFRAAAQLPLSHGYYQDHLQTPARFDVLLLLEAARQASTHGAHLHLDLPLNTTFLVNGWSLHLDEPDALLIGERPGELELTETVTRTVGRGGRLRALRFDMELAMRDRTVGRAHIEVGATTSEEYEKLRFLQRRTTAPLTSQQTGRPGGAPVDAARVGRLNPANVVLGEPVVRDGFVTAALSPRFDNRSLFDHVYDHYPAMVLMEAARQLSFLALAAGDGTPAGRAVVTGVEARFTRYAELDGPIEVTTPVATGSGRREHEFPVTFIQDSQAIAEIGFTLRGDTE
ncbi:ScbA/BarX family gamma-butyrolactone biosynthesis protein [Streptomyces sp. NPDC053048]|uniref:ScbA/BarX family gamma-butyrolactone biosynthesis protein n=1 Tax=Streptomyces sp. NPDC053048 TaxID=3365694 RepID=UPI0037CD0EAC